MNVARCLTIQAVLPCRLFILCAWFTCTAHAAEVTPLNTLTGAEKNAGWKLLFDGRTTEGWRAYKGETMPPSWKVVNGSLVSLPKDRKERGDIVTIEQFDNFELTFDWKMAPGGNSGVQYRVTGAMKNPWESGLEYQVLDNHQQTGHVDGLNPLSSASACYALYAPSKDMTQPVGEWNQARIVANGRHIEHWLNGERVVAFDIGTRDWQAHLKTSKFINTPNYGRAPRGHLCLQDYGSPIEFRNIKIRALPGGSKDAPATTDELAPATSLADPRVRFTVPEKPYVVLRRGPIEAVVVDNREVNDDVLPEHRAGYNGLGSLKHAQQPRNLFVPRVSGLNFEHIHDGTVQPRDILFEPRHAPMELRVIDVQTAELYQPPTPHWGLESCTRFRLLDEDVIELTFECIPRREAFKNGYIGLFWASYIDQPESLDIHFIGRPAGEPHRKSDWIRGITPAHGELPTHLALDDDREFMHDAAFPLTLVFNRSRHRFAEPWYVGFCRGMAYAQIFRASDRMRLSQSPSGGGAGNPAWDFQWFIPEYRVGQRYTFTMRALYRPVADPGNEATSREQIRAGGVDGKLWPAPSQP